MDEDCARCDEEVTFEGNDAVGSIDGDCLVLNKEVIVEDTTVVVEVTNKDSLVLAEEIIVEDNKVVGARVVLLYITAETAREYVSVGYNRLSCLIPRSVTPNSSLHK